MNAYQKQEYAKQAQFLAGLKDANTGFQGKAVMLQPDQLQLNLHPAFADKIIPFFAYKDDKGAQTIDWHTRANHGASSQVCCVNFLFPLVHDQRLASAWVNHVLGIEGAEVEPIDSRCGQDAFVTFEWFPEFDYLNESNSKGIRARGSNSTSVDAALRYSLSGQSHLLMIEWKYTEAYGATRGLEGDGTRDGRYANIWQRPNGPIRADAKVKLNHFYLNPWYQLLRQQMLAYHCELDPMSGFDKVRLLHISPGGNEDLKRAKGHLAKFTGEQNVFEAFASLIEPHFSNRFITVDTADAFRLPEYSQSSAAAWLADRYSSLVDW